MRWVLSCFFVLSLMGTSRAEQRFESFDRDPGWDAHHNRSLYPETIRQDFGYSADTAHVGGARGEVGGTIQPAAEAAYFALPLTGLSLQTPFSASGKLFVQKGGGHFLLGFFNDSTQNEWRTPNTAVFRIIQRGEIFYCYPEYPRGYQGAPRIYPDGTSHSWTLEYLPVNSATPARMVVTLDGQRVEQEVPAAVLTENLVFDHFGLVTPWIDGNGQTVYFDDIDYTVCQEK